MQAEIHCGNHHEQAANEQNGIALEVAHAGIVGGKATNGHGGKRVCHGVEASHPGGPEGQCAHDSQAEVDEKQCLGGFRYARCELAVLGGAGDFCPVQLHAADAQHGQYRHGDHDDADAAQPLQQLTVDKN